MGEVLHRLWNWSPALAAVAITLTATVALAAETPARPEHLTIRPDPAVRRGVLPNGMRYQVMRNASPADAVSLRFAVDVGSYEEGDAERGWAHFIEHMAFRSTRSFPDGAIERVFAPAGVAFGRDQNALTTLFSTVYQVDLPKPDDSQLQSAFSWLRDVADGVVFTPDAVNHERGVVLSEMEARNSPMLMAQEAVGVFQAPGQRSTNRSPIGLRTTLNAATPQGLERFYRAWYRPSHAVLTVVGDRPVEALEASVKAAFSSWQASGPTRERARVVQPAGERPTDAFAVVGPALPTAVSACRVSAAPPQGPDDIARLRRLARTQIWQQILNQRLERRVAAGDASLLGAGVTSNDARDLMGVCLVVVPVGEAWPEALKAARGELNSFAATGPTEIETEKATELIRSRLRGAASAAGSRSSPEIAAVLSAREIAGEVFAAPADALYAYDVAVENLTPEAIKASFDAEWSGGPPLLAMTSPTPVAREAMLAAWGQGAEAVAGTQAGEAVAQVWAYGSFGKPGKVVEQKLIENPGFQRFRFANGVVVNFKQTKFAPNKVEVRAHFGVGRREVDKRDYVAAELGQTLLVAGGLGRHRISALQAMFATSGVLDFTMGMGPESFAISTSTFSGSLDEQLEVLAAYMTDPGFDPSLDGRISASVDLIYRTLLTQPSAAVSIALIDAAAPEAASRMPPREVMAAIRSADFARVLKPILTTAPIELTIVGDVDQATAISAIASTFGALPARPATARAKGDPSFTHYPDKAPPLIRAEHDGPADTAAATMIWPLYVSTPERRREEYAIKLLAAVFDTALRQRIREELGKTYAPSVSSVGPDHGDQGVLQVGFEAGAKDLDTLIEEARAIAAKLAAGNITASMLQNARQPLVASAGSLRQSNLWWAGAMGGSARQPAILQELLEYDTLMNAVTVDDLKAAAATWLNRDPIVAVAYPRQAAKGGSQ